MRSKSVLLLTLALGCGLVASIGISQVMDKRSKQGPAGETEPVFVALADIAFGEELTAKNIKLEEWPKGKVPTGAVSKLEDVEKKRTRVKLFAGEPILAAKLAAPGDSNGIAPEIPKGYRVASVRIDAVSGTAGLIEPGNRVDVLVHLPKNAANGIQEPKTLTLLQDIAVFAVDTITLSRRQNDKDDQPITAKTVSLLLTPVQAEKVTLATELGQIRLVLRGVGDATPVAGSGVTSEDITGGGGEKGDRKKESDGFAAKPQENKGNLMDLLRGNGAAKTNEPKLGQVAAVESHAWKMVLLKGAEVTQCEFPDENALPLGLPSSSAKPADDKVDEPQASPAPDGAKPTSSGPASAPAPKKDDAASNSNADSRE